jgi:hypothetical protein
LTHTPTLKEKERDTRELTTSFSIIGPCGVRVECLRTFPIENINREEKGVAGPCGCSSCFLALFCIFLLKNKELAEWVLD